MHNIEVMDWPPLSSSLNPIGNMWAHLAWKLYENGCQYLLAKNLTTEQAWYGLSPEVAQNLALSMKNCVLGLKKIKTHLHINI